MKRCLLVLAAIAIICFAACKKDIQKQPSNGAPPSADSFLPVTAGSSWTYAVNGKYSTDTVTVKMNATNVTENGKTYYTANSISKHSGSSGIYFYEKDHIYAIHSFNIYADTVLDLQLYNDTATVFHTWYSSPTPSGKIGNTAARVASMINQTNGTQTFGGKTYKNVVQVEVSIQYDTSGLGFYSDTNIYVYYLVKGIGIIAYTSTFLDEANGDEQLLSYDVK